MGIDEPFLDSISLHNGILKYGIILNFKPMIKNCLQKISKQVLHEISILKVL